MTIYCIAIDTKKKCRQCDKEGAVVGSGLCWSCISKNLKDPKYDDILKKYGEPSKMVESEKKEAVSHDRINNS